MLLFVGLGNPTPDSENNRHNVGFKIIDSINKEFGLSKQKPKFKGLLTTGNIGNKKVYAIKPLTFMNNSGICIRELIEYFKIDAEDVIVFHDDLDLEFGKIKSNENIILADEISPDTCRLWDQKTDKKLDKDRFRKDLGNIVEAYQEVARRLGILHEQSNIRPIKFSKPTAVKIKKNK